MKNNTKILRRSSLKLVLSLCIGIFLVDTADAQGTRVEDFSSEVYIQPVVTNDILGNTLQAGNRLTYEFIKNIAPGTGRWFSTNNGGATFKWVDGLGETGDGVLSCIDDRAGSVMVQYVFNNTDASVGGSLNFTGRYFRDADIADRIGLTFYAIEIDENDPDSDLIYTLRATGTGSSNDNVVRNGFNTSAIHSVGREIFHNGGDHDGVVGQGWQDMFSALATMDADWLILSIAFGHDKSYDGALEGKQLLDDLVIPYGNSNLIAPIIESVVEVSPGNLGVFANEMGPLHLVPAGTEGTKAAIEAASIKSDTTIFALPTVGSEFPLDGIADGKYDFFVIDQDGNPSLGTQINIGADTYAPLITGGVTSVYAGFDDITATMDEAGTLKLVADGAGSAGTEVLSVSAAEKTLTTLVVPETVAAGQYDLYAIDAAGNASSTPIDITVEVPDVAPPAITFTGATEITTTDTIYYQTDEEALLVYIAPQGTAGDFEAVKAAALDSAFGPLMSGKFAAVNLSEGFYELYAQDRFGNFGTTGGTIEVADLSGPVAFSITSGTLDKGFPIAVTINENGHVYVVPAGTAVGDVLTAAIVSDTAIAATRVVLPTDGDGFVKGQSYDIYAADARPNWSELLSTVIIAEDEASSVLSTDIGLEVSVYPNPAIDIINVDVKELLELQLFDLGGKSVLKSTGLNFLNVANVENGIYLLNIRTKLGSKMHKIVISH